MEITLFQKTLKPFCFDFSKIFDLLKCVDTADACTDSNRHNIYKLVFFVVMPGI